MNMPIFEATSGEQRGERPGLSQVCVVVDSLIRELLHAPDEVQLDTGWSQASATVAEFSLRPAKRVRPALLISGHGLASGAQPTDAAWRFAAALELLHTFMLAHDDVADALPEHRRGTVSGSVAVDAAAHQMVKGKAGVADARRKEVTT